MKLSCTRAGRWLMVLFGLPFCSCPAGFAAESPFLYGIHDADPDPSEFLNHIKSGTGGTGG